MYRAPHSPGSRPGGRLGPFAPVVPSRPAAPRDLAARVALVAALGAWISPPLISLPPPAAADPVAEADRLRDAGRVEEALRLVEAELAREAIKAVELVDFPLDALAGADEAGGEARNGLHQPDSSPHFAASQAGSIAVGPFALYQRLAQCRLQRGMPVESACRADGARQLICVGRGMGKLPVEPRLPGVHRP